MERSSSGKNIQTLFFWTRDRTRAGYQLVGNEFLHPLPLLKSKEPCPKRVPTGTPIHQTGQIRHQQLDRMEKTHSDLFFTYSWSSIRSSRLCRSSRAYFGTCRKAQRM